MRRLLIVLLILLAITYNRVLANSELNIELELPERAYAGFECNATIRISNPPEGTPIKVLWIRLITPWGTKHHSVNLELSPGTNLTQEITLRIPLEAKTPAYVSIKATIRVYDFERAKQVTFESDSVRILIDRVIPKVSLKVNTSKQNLTPEEPFELLVSYSIVDLPGGESPTLKITINDSLINSLNLSEPSADLYFNLTAPKNEGTYEIRVILYYIVGEESDKSFIYVSRRFGFREKEAWEQILAANQSLEFVMSLYNAAKEQIEVPEEALSLISLAGIRIEQALDAFQEANNSVFSLARDSFNASNAAIKIILTTYQEKLSALISPINATVEKYSKILSKPEMENVTRSLENVVEIREKILDEPENAPILYEEAISDLEKANLTLNRAISRYHTRIRILSLCILTILTISFFLMVYVSRVLYRVLTSS